MSVSLLSTTFVPQNFFALINTSQVTIEKGTQKQADVEVKEP